MQPEGRREGSLRMVPISHRPAPSEFMLELPFVPPLPSFLLPICSRGHCIETSYVPAVEGMADKALPPGSVPPTPFFNIPPQSSQALLHYDTTVGAPYWPLDVGNENVTRRPCPASWQYNLSCAATCAATGRGIGHEDGAHS